MQQLAEDDVQFIRHSTPEIWDQMRDLVRTMPWTSMDEAMWQLLPEMKNIYPVFAIRKSDNCLLGGVALVERDVIFGAFYLIRPEVRGLGVGLKMIAHVLDSVAKASKIKPMLARAVTAMVEKYSGPPFYAIHHHELYLLTLPRKELLQLFPCSGSTLVPKSFKEMNAEQFDKVCAYDQLVTGRDRKEFLKTFHSLFFTKGCGRRMYLFLRSTFLTPSMAQKSLINHSKAVRLVENGERGEHKRGR
ncbi:hypothetical protein ANCDUO_08617 [Ancylostoma duodenale]|uniref:N-acetyltransferase domain-containing protein n=1 Tax=Ancylostoma duodenale TaxID=51022 RepID=A0A0C2DF86_9BILA|nr:hypothetical protein ANCDUO_08617 [Ancylostoma duodenale]